MNMSTTAELLVSRVKKEKYQRERERERERERPYRRRNSQCAVVKGVEMLTSLATEYATYAAD